eukprot:CAMPEP_0119070282 /NCGR_PEP_ID=MMETSP1178-20130426/37910_1 /TAXON_ID=33656 /ORGANISM="unid sp, Strain CCMP2000" /LENGTH=208 /DNA_ID=CAMNT_0007052103 /DNA_START=17 /DNA_END=643 /DNA_ORIENTATION=+
MPLRLAVLLSGSGTTLQNILDRIADGTLNGVEVTTVVSSRKDAAGIGRAERAGVPHVSVVESRTYRKEKTIDWVAHSSAINGRLRDAGGVDLVVLAGFMCFYHIEKGYENRVINVHPALLPKHGGQGMYGDHVHTAVLAAKETISGCTVHFVDDQGYDKGPIILQREVSVDAASDTVETLRNRVQAAEKEALIEVIAAARDGGVQLGR